MSALAFTVGFAAGWIAGWITLAAILRVLRRELDLYRRSRGVTIDYTHRSRS